MFFFFFSLTLFFRFVVQQFELSFMIVASCKLNEIKQIYNV